MQWWNVIKDVIYYPVRTPQPILTGSHNFFEWMRIRVPQLFWPDQDQDFATFYDRIRIRIPQPFLTGSGSGFCNFFWPDQDPDSATFFDRIRIWILQVFWPDQDPDSATFFDRTRIRIPQHFLTGSGSGFHNLFWPDQDPDSATFLTKSINCKWLLNKWSKY